MIRHNQELGNKGFAFKKEFYKHRAGLQIAQNFIIDQDSWNDLTIQNRTKELSKFLVKEVLPIPEQMQTANNYTSKDYSGVHFEVLDLIGKNVYFLEDPSIEVKVIDDKHVEYDNKKYSLSNLTRIIKISKGSVNASGKYQGPKYWGYNGSSLYNLMLLGGISEEEEDDDDNTEIDED